MNWERMHEPADKPKGKGSPMSWALYALIALYQIMSRFPDQARQDGRRKVAADERFQNALREDAGSALTGEWGLARGVSHFACNGQSQLSGCDACLTDINYQLAPLRVLLTAGFCMYTASAVSEAHTDTSYFSQIT